MQRYSGKAHRFADLVAIVAFLFIPWLAKLNFIPKYGENGIKMIKRVGKVRSFATNATMAQ